MNSSSPPNRRPRRRWTMRGGAKHRSRQPVWARPLVTNAGVPPERVAALRHAFEATMADPMFLEDAARQSLEINGKRGEELQKMVSDMIATPPAVLEKV